MRAPARRRREAIGRVSQCTHGRRASLKTDRYTAKRKVYLSRSFHERPAKPRAEVVLNFLLGEADEPSAFVRSQMSTSCRTNDAFSHRGRCFLLLPPPQRFGGAGLNAHVYMCIRRTPCMYTVPRAPFFIKDYWRHFVFLSKRVSWRARMLYVCISAGGDLLWDTFFFFFRNGDPSAA